MAHGAELTVALGQSYSYFNDGNRGPLERAFDFDALTLTPQLSDAAGFTRTRTSQRGLTLKKEGYLTLKIGAEAQIENRPGSDGWIRAYTFTPSGNIVVGSDFSLKSYDRTGKLLHEYVGHMGYVGAVSASSDGRYLVSGSDDQTVKLWNLHSGELLATLFVSTDGEWVVYTPQGYYEASAGGERYVGWHINRGWDKEAEYYSSYVFRDQYHQPELVRRVIALGSYDRAWAELEADPRRRLRTEPVTEVSPPRVEWLLPSVLQTETTSETMRIRARIVSDRKLTEVKVLVNGRPQAVLGMLDEVEEAGGHTVVIGHEVALEQGRNEVAIYAAHGVSGVQSDRRLVEVKAGVPNRLKPNLYMVSIGIADYAMEDIGLEYPDDDVRAMSRLYRTQQGRLFNEVHIRELIDADATQDAILAALEWLDDQATQKDVVVLFMAAHGLMDTRGNYYVLPVDGNPDELRRTAVDWRDFGDILGDLPSKVLLFMDTCHSGQLGVNLANQRRVDNTEAIRLLTSDEFGVVTVAASTGREASREHPDWGHGAFTKALIEALEEGKADLTPDGIIYLRELDHYVAERVKQLTDGDQHPHTIKPPTITRLPIFQIR